MKKLAFEYAGSFNMPSMKMVKIERENVMFSTPTSVFNYNKGENTASLVGDKVSLALGNEIELASSQTGEYSSAV